MHCFQNAVDFFIIFANETDIQANPLDVAVNDVTELIRFISSADNGIILVLSLCKVQSGHVD